VVPLYRAVSELEIQKKVNVGGLERGIITEVLDKFYEDQLRTLNGGALRARVLAMIRNSKNPRPEPASLALEARRGQGSAFTLTVLSTDQEYARLYGSLWGKAFLQLRKDQTQKALDDKKYGVHEELLKEKANLEEARKATDKFRRDHQIGSASDTYKAAQAQLENLKTQLASTQTARGILEKTTREALASGAVAAENRPERNVRPAERGGNREPAETSDPLSKFTQDSGYVVLRSQLNDKQAQFNYLTNTLKGKHPAMVTLTRELADVNRKLDFQLQLIEDKRKATIDSLRLNEEALVGQITELNGQVQRLRGVQDEFERLQKAEKGFEDHITTINTSLAQIDLTPDEVQFAPVSDEPVMSREDPRKSRIIMQGVGMGFLVGLALVYFLNRLDDRLELAEDIEEALEEPVLGQVPQVDLRSVGEGCLLITKLHRHNMFAESVRGVRSAIMLGAREGRKQAMLVSSAVPGDGKTTFTVNFAATMAIAGNRVLLVDADLRRGNIHNYFKLNREPGVTEILMGETHWTDVLGATEIKTLNVITTGRLPAHPGELLVGSIMQQFIQEARQQYDYVIVDCPPLTAIDDAFSLIGLMDGLLFVVRSGQTSMRFAKTALAAVRQRGAEIIGIVLNGITADNPYYYYNYYYHSYYNRADTGPSTGAETGVGQKMALPKRQRLAEKTIVGEAMSIAGQEPSMQEVEKEAKAKAELFKARRAARKREATGDTGFVSKDAVAGPGPGPGAPTAS
jgi:capsular exopolysaccharide synthesis family protein